MSSCSRRSRGASWTGLGSAKFQPLPQRRGLSLTRTDPTFGLEKGQRALTVAPDSGLLLWLQAGPLSPSPRPSTHVVSGGPGPLCGQHAEGYEARMAAGGPIVASRSPALVRGLDSEAGGRAGVSRSPWDSRTLIVQGHLPSPERGQSSQDGGWYKDSWVCCGSM